MLEDSAMDKKAAGRSAQTSCKGNGTDVKKSQDASSTNKSFPRGPRKRESNSNTPNVPKYDQSRKPQSQKSRTFDKRPRARGQYFAGGKEDSKVEEERADFGSGLAAGSKKVNLNHLLNFHYTPKDGGRGAHVGQGPPRWLHGTQRHKYNKEQFLQANCQFVVKAGGNYERYFHDPDTLVEWDLIEQIRVQSSVLLSCPICLSAPTAARMTRCGHIYCWPCMLHYLALADKSWRKCPICYESVHREDLKSVVALQHAELSVGNIVTMQLMRRERGTLVAAPVHAGGASATLHTPLSVAETSENTLYCKLLVASPHQVLEILQQESGELQVRLAEEVGTAEMCFTEQALDLLSQRHEVVSGCASIVKPITPVEEKPKEVETQSEIHTVSQSAVVYKSAFDNEIQQQEDEETNQRARYESMSSEGKESTDNAVFQVLEDDITAEDLETPTMLQQATADTSTSKYFYFYQAADGQHMYLHSLNARMLEAMYGGLEMSPITLKARIVEKEAGSMTTELRQRLRYLQHLPVTCQFEVVELDLRPPLVSRVTLNQFQEQLEQRRKKRQRRARDERRREKRIIEEENKRYGRYPTPEISIESRAHFPECGTNNSPPIYEMPGLVTSDFPPVEPMQQLQLDDSSAGPSFAQMLREGKCQREVFPALRRQPAPQTTCAASSHSDTEPDPEGYVPAPAFSHSFGDAFALALERAANKEEEPKDQSNGRKKKKPKQKVLFSTGMACNSK